MGCFALRATSLKQILAYTTISQLGYIFLGVAVGEGASLKYSFLYLFFYGTQIFGFVLILVLLQSYTRVTTVHHLSIIKHVNIFYYYILLLLLFSLCGVPPLAGFFIKYFLFLEVYRAGYFVFAFLSLVSGYIMSLIYLNLILALLNDRSFSSMGFSTYQFKQLHIKSIERTSVLVSSVTTFLLVFLAVLITGFIIFVPIGTTSLGNFIVAYFFTLV